MTEISVSEYFSLLIYFFSPELHAAPLKVQLVRKVIL